MADLQAERFRNLVASGDAASVLAEVDSLANRACAEAAEAGRQQGLAAAAASAAAAGPAAPAPGAFRRPEPPKPDPFCGDPKSSPTVESWLLQMNSYLGLYPGLSGQGKVRWSVGYLKGSALLWWQHEVNSSGSPLPFATLRNFQAALLAAFLDLHFVERARHALASCRQTSSVRQYLDAFKAICLRIPADELLDAEKQQHFVDGLKPQVSREVLLKFPRTFAAAAAIADQYDRLAYDHSFLSSSSDSSYTSGGPFALGPDIKYPSSSSAATGPTAMELGAIQTWAGGGSRQRPPL